MTEGALAAVFRLLFLPGCFGSVRGEPIAVVCLRPGIVEACYPRSGERISVCVCVCVCVCVLPYVIVRWQSRLSRLWDTFSSVQFRSR